MWGRYNLTRLYTSHGPIPIYRFQIQPIYFSKVLGATPNIPKNMYPKCILIESVSPRPCLWLTRIILIIIMPNLFLLFHLNIQHWKDIGNATEPCYTSVHQRGAPCWAMTCQICHEERPHDLRRVKALSSHSMAGTRGMERSSFHGVFKHGRSVRKLSTFGISKWWL